MDSVVVKFENFCNFKENLRHDHFSRQNHHKKFYKSTN